MDQIKKKIVGHWGTVPGQNFVPVLCEGRGTVRCQHGILPIPVPAVANIVSANHLHLKMTEVEGELVTPTGAAIVAAVKTKDKLPETFEFFCLSLCFISSFSLLCAF